jgi:hypothetical protein
MKQIVLLLAVGSVIFFSSCESTKEITLKPDGSATYVNTMDMSSALGMASMAGQTKELEKMKEEKPVDTTIELSVIADNANDLSEEERRLVKNGTLGINMDIKNDKMIIKLNYPIGNVSDISTLDKASQKVIMQFLKAYMNGAKDQMPPGMDGQMPEVSVDQYYSFISSAGVVEKRLMKEKYDAIGGQEKEGLKALSQAGMGNTTLVINVPSPVKRTEGKNLVVSDDKMKVTITADAEDFFTNPKDLEFRIEY